MEELSCSERMTNWSNQHDDSGNVFRNFVGREASSIGHGAGSTLVSWPGQQQVIESEAVGREKEMLKKELISVAR